MKYDAKQASTEGYFVTGFKMVGFSLATGCFRIHDYLFPFWGSYSWGIISVEMREYFLKCWIFVAFPRRRSGWWSMSCHLRDDSMHHPLHLVDILLLLLLFSHKSICCLSCWDWTLAYLIMADQKCLFAQSLDWLNSLFDVKWKIILFSPKIVNLYFCFNFSIS